MLTNIKVTHFEFLLRKYKLIAETLNIFFSASFFNKVLSEFPKRTEFSFLNTFNPEAVDFFASSANSLAII